MAQTAVCMKCGKRLQTIEAERCYVGMSALLPVVHSKAHCDACGSELGGNRTPAHAVTTWEADHNGPVGERIGHFRICDDCVYYAEYGRLDDMTMLEIEESIG